MPMLGKYDSYMSIIYMTNPGYKILVNMNSQTWITIYQTNITVSACLKNIRVKEAFFTGVIYMSNPKYDSRKHENDYSCTGSFV